MNHQIRNAEREDLPRIEEIYAYARSFMAQSGNPNQRRILKTDCCL